MQQWICLLLALAAGFASGVQGPANGALARAWGLPRSVALNGGIVFLGTLVGIFFFGREKWVRPSLPWTYYIGGFCGLTIICAAAFSVPRLGAADFTVALVLGMLTASVLVDSFGWYGQPTVPISPLRLAGLGCIVLGVILVRLTRNA